jgi:phosphoribosylformimino-5-aminoimidazole carboxamide ribotide isomerase
MRIIPAIDIINGQCVRLTQGDYGTEKVYHKDPVTMAKIFEDAGFSYLHLVDLDGAKARKIQNLKVLERIVQATNLQIDFGGGLQHANHISAALQAGAHQVVLGTVALHEPTVFEEYLYQFGVHRIILGADCKHGRIATQGWLHCSTIEVGDFIKSKQEQGVLYASVTDIAKDGMLAGPSFTLYKNLLAATKIKLIASGGISTYEDVMALKTMGCEGAIIGKAIYENKIKLKQLSALC